MIAGILPSTFHTCNQNDRAHIIDKTGLAVMQSIVQNRWTLDTYSDLFHTTRRYQFEFYAIEALPYAKQDPLFC